MSRRAVPSHAIGLSATDHYTNFYILVLGTANEGPGEASQCFFSAGRTLVRSWRTDTGAIEKAPGTFPPTSATPVEAPGAVPRIPFPAPPPWLQNWVDFRGLQGNHEDSVTASKVVRISSLRQKRASRESFSNCRYEVATPGASTIFVFAPAVAFGDFAPPRACGRRRSHPSTATPLRRGLAAAATRVQLRHREPATRRGCECGRRAPH